MKNVIYFSLRISLLFCLVLVALPTKATSKVSEIETVVQAKKTVSGQVTDQNGFTLIGVSVKVKGTNIGTITNVDGEFELRDIEEGAILQFTYVGFEEQEVVVGAASSISVVLKEDLMQLDEVVVVGYGSFKKRDLTGAITQVKGDDIAKLPVRSASDALQGKAAGVTVTSSSGSPGSMGSVRIRGYGTINNNDPLYVVDGTPQTSIGWLNPSDILNMEVLKDASSQAIYGSRAANGVIMITTKRGDAGGAAEGVIEFDMNVGFQNIYKRPNVLDAEGFMTYKNLATENGWDKSTGKPVEYPFPADQMSQILTFLEKNGGRQGTDWWKEVTRSTLDAPIQNYNLAFSKGDGRNNYRASFNYMGQEGVVNSSDYQRITGRLNMDTEIKKWFKLSTNVAVGYEDRRNLLENDSFTGTVFSTMTADPITPVYRNNLVDIPDFLKNTIMSGYEPNNPWSQYAGIIYSNKPNVVAQTDLQGLNKWSGIFVKGNVSGEFKILPTLTFRSNIAVDLSRGKSSGFTPKYHLDSDQYSQYARASRTMSETDYWVFDNYLTYAEDFGKHSLNVMLGISAEKTRYEELYGSRRGMSTNAESQQIINAGTEVVDAKGYHYYKKMHSYFGRVFYSYDSRYLLTVNLRRDGSSNFGDGHRWGTFPSVSLGWNFSEENFMENQDWLSQGKFRAGWGEIGNENIGGGAYLTKYGLTGGYGIFGGNDPIPLAGLTQQGNPDVKWETTRQLNFGLDLAFLNGALRASFDYFKRDTKDMLIQRPVSDLLGFPNNPWVNIGSVENRGFEVSLEYSGKIGADFTYNISGNLSTYRNRIKNMGGVKMPGGSSSSGVQLHQGIKTYSMLEEGMPMGYFIGYKTDGIFQTEDEIQNYVNNGQVVMPNAQPGDLKYVDINQDGVINDEDRVRVGNPHPAVTYGFTLGAQYKGFDFSAFFQGVSGNEILNLMKLDSYQSTGWYNAPSDIFEKAWHGPGTSNDFFRISTEQRSNHEPSDWTIEDGSYLRLKNITLGYTLPNQLTKKIFAKDVRFYLSAQNLFTVTDYSGLDPDLGGSSQTRALGVDQGWYPQARVFMFGLSFKL